MEAAIKKLQKDMNGLQDHLKAQDETLEPIGEWFKRKLKSDERWHKLGEKLSDAFIENLAKVLVTVVCVAAGTALGLGALKAIHIGG